MGTKKTPGKFDCYAKAEPDARQGVRCHSRRMPSASVNFIVSN